MNATHATTSRGYAPVNGLKMYYEIEGGGEPLVYVPPAFAYAGLKSFSALVQSRSVITVDLQGHGHTADIAERPITFEQHAKDVVGLLRHLGIASTRAMQADNDGCRFPAVGAGRNVEEILASLTGREDRPIVSILRIERVAFSRFGSMFYRPPSCREVARSDRELTR